ncbi:hypothetical protein GALL_324100 [mine drainage metagenome]|uniref:Uncharacterized protein n=1 Tax=mine drainage metagenome TaxID=410659 RepID=A0A1J5R7P9_9ZZZZ
MSSSLVAMVRVDDVRVPNVGPFPELYKNTPLVQMLLVLGIVGVILLAFQALGARRRAQAGKALLAPFVVTVVLMVLPLAAAYVLTKTGEDRAFERINAYNTDQSAVVDQIVPQLEQQFGVVIHEPSLIPTEDGEHLRVDMTLPDGSRQKCFVIAQRTYQIRCGSDNDPAGGTPLAPVANDSGS